MVVFHGGVPWRRIGGRNLAGVSAGPSPSPWWAFTITCAITLPGLFLLLFLVLFLNRDVLPERHDHGAGQPPLGPHPHRDAGAVTVGP